MTSIHTNTMAMAALGTLRSISGQLSAEQDKVSSGLRINTAADNAAYWSISTTMRSDNMAISAVSDALGLGAAKVDVAYAGLNSVVDVLKEFKAKLVAAEEDGVDKAKVQAELDQLKEQVQSIATSASFSGVNWLNTDIADIYDKTLNRASTVSSFARDATGGVSVKTMDVNLSQVSLFNSTGGGLLQADPCDLGTIGGLRFSTGSDVMRTYSAGNTMGSGPSDDVFHLQRPAHIRCRRPDFLRRDGGCRQPRGRHLCALSPGADHLHRDRPGDGRCCPPVGERRDLNLQAVCLGAELRPLRFRGDGDDLLEIPDEDQGRYPRSRRHRLSRQLISGWLNRGPRPGRNRAGTAPLVWSRQSGESQVGLE
ncbi:flagellin D [Sinorhizobium fredii USDA 257]|uniref:Flagellin D n=1 Tax=Sinorhizobium fredii (strain USDA 257) TaxID=1185652 RepID=I3XBU7_SINF2|nr:flagellin D [Sinorhizobium fredii USDA 257]